ncbi:hypothetical protein [Saccharococcus caldoxylosilyticus]|uniref:hypothetical protein n=1 Tax=Saccharococcus caldoxylosilyticus TaxID=81408 RepID=UPI001FCC4A06|nr:hypothetical protein [Parageobacillus caldoxylosilyticus]BDG39941.1 hypothetical protein PcaKH16_20800 [Parageobacillus caldoxylosilyticus]
MIFRSRHCYVQRYEVKRKRVRSLWIMSTITAAVFVFLAVLGYFGFQENEVSVLDGKLIVEGWYGEEWAVGDIEDVRLLERLPEVIVKTNGFAAMGRLKGEFVLEKPYGSGKLFIVERSSPYVYVKHKNGAYMIVNFHTPDETKALFDTLRKEAEKRSSRLSERDLVAEAKRRWLARGNFS